MPSLLSLQGMSKSFAGTPVLDDVALQIQVGEVHALVGQNGSGKSTLIKILAGYYAPEGASVVAIDGVEFSLGHPAAALAAGLRFVHQDLGLVDSLSVTENLALGRGFVTGLARRIRWRTERRNAAQMIEALGFDFDVRRPVGELSQAERAGVAIARALWNWEEDARVLVMDEPTASLPSSDVESLFGAIRRVQARQLGVLYVSHRLEEVFSIADRVTVLRDGRVAACEDVADLSQDRLIELMVGSAVVRVPKDAARITNDPVLSVRSLAGEQLRGIDFNVRAGEILGFAGLTGSGREELLPLLYGSVPRDGSVSVGDVEIRGGDPRAASRAGVALVPADRHRQGLVLNMTVRENTTLTRLKTFRSPIGAISSKRELAEVREWLMRLDVRPPLPERAIWSLSGGNQQKIALAKWLRLEPRVVLLDEPTQGVDVGAKATIHQLVADVARRGAAVVIASSDDEEICDVCDRVFVLRDGMIVAELTGGDLTTDKLGRIELGGAAAPSAA